LFVSKGVMSSSNLTFKPGEDIDDFAFRLNTLQQNMVPFDDDTYGEERAIEKLF
jgi:hypothetical protein